MSQLPDPFDPDVTTGNTSQEDFAGFRPGELEASVYDPDDITVTRVDPLESAMQAELNRIHLNQHTAIGVNENIFSEGDPLSGLDPDGSSAILGEDGVPKEVVKRDEPLSREWLQSWWGQRVEEDGILPKENTTSTENMVIDPFNGNAIDPEVIQQSAEAPTSLVPTEVDMELLTEEIEKVSGLDIEEIQDMHSISTELMHMGEVCRAQVMNFAMLSPGFESLIPHPGTFTAFPSNLNHKVSLEAMGKTILDRIKDGIKRLREWITGFFKWLWDSIRKRLNFDLRYPEPDEMIKIRTEHLAKARMIDGSYGIRSYESIHNHTVIEKASSTENWVAQYYNYRTHEAFEAIWNEGYRRISRDADLPNRLRTMVELADKELTFIQTRVKSINNAGEVRLANIAAELRDSKNIDSEITGLGRYWNVTFKPEDDVRERTSLVVSGIHRSLKLPATQPAKEFVAAARYTNPNARGAIDKSIRAMERIADSLDKELLGVERSLAKKESAEGMAIAKAISAAQWRIGNVRELMVGINAILAIYTRYRGTLHGISFDIGTKLNLLSAAGSIRDFSDQMSKK